VFLFVTFLVIFKKERNKELEEDDDPLKINIIQSYELLWDIFKIKHMKLLLMAILTSMVINMFIQFPIGILEIVRYLQTKSYNILHIILLQLTCLNNY